MPLLALGDKSTPTLPLDFLLIVSKKSPPIEDLGFESYRLYTPSEKSFGEKLRDLIELPLALLH